MGLIGLMGILTYFIIHNSDIDRVTNDENHTTAATVQHTVAATVLAWPTATITTTTSTTTYSNDHYSVWHYWTTYSNDHDWTRT